LSRLFSRHSQAIFCLRSASWLESTAISLSQFVWDFLSDAARDHLPSRLVAFESGELVGTIVLREQGSASLPEFRPELGGLFVVDSQRGHGIGSELVRAGMQLALDLGYEMVFATTVAAAGILERLGWEFIITIAHHDQQISVYRYKRSVQLPNA
jgi:RimJ/RimL family protein N-acetyltransferase